jgi:hypothetical protein
MKEKSKGPCNRQYAGGEAQLTASKGINRTASASDNVGTRWQESVASSVAGFDFSRDQRARGAFAANNSVDHVCDVALAFITGLLVVCLSDGKGIRRESVHDLSPLRALQWRHAGSLGRGASVLLNVTRVGPG